MHVKNFNLAGIVRYCGLISHNWIFKPFQKVYSNILRKKIDWPWPLAWGTWRATGVGRRTAFIFGSVIFCVSAIFSIFFNFSKSALNKYNYNKLNVWKYKQGIYTVQVFFRGESPLVISQSVARNFSKSGQKNKFWLR